MIGEGTYHIGQYTFDSYEEYLDGQEDMELIKHLIHEVDFDDPEQVVALYRLIRSGKVTFKTKVGRGFFGFVSDKVAGKTVTLAKQEEKYGEDLKETSKGRKLAGILIIAAAAVCFLVFGLGELRSLKNARALEELQGQMDEAKKSLADEYVAPFSEETENESVSDEVTKGDTSDASVPEVVEDNEVTEREYVDPSSLKILSQFADIYERNNDFIGWLTIDNTVINYPVMQIEGDNSYYLSHSFDKDSDNNGTLFVDGRNDVVNRDVNIIIYGHNMRSGNMFGGLKSYLDEDYMLLHQMIQFDTIYETGTYKVVGVGLSEVEYQDDDAFRYYNFLDAADEDEFEYYIDELKQLIVVGDMDVEYGDELLTLSTCNSYTEDGRMFVIAKRIR